MLTPWNQLDRPQTTPADELLEMHDALLEVDPEWRIVRVNANQERLSMKPRSRTLGRSLWEAFPEIADPETESWRNYRRCMRDRVPVQFQDYYAPLDMWTGVTAYPTSTGGIVIFFRDISSTKRLQQDQERLAAIVETSDDAIISKDLNGIVQSWNRAAAQLFGYAADEIIGTPIARLLPPDRLDEEERILRDLRAGQRIDHYETKRVRKDGVVVEVSVTVSPLFDEHGEVTGASKIARDVTERRRAERAVRDSEEKFRSVFESAAVGIGRVGLDGRFIEVNQAYARIVGYSRDELVRLDFQAITHRDDLEADLNQLADLTSGRIASYTMEKRYIRKDGDTVWVSLSVGLARRGDGEPAYAAVVVEDITARKWTEQALRDANEQLREVDRRRTQFISVLGHELRNPLAPIRNSIFLLQRVPADSPQAIRSRQVLSRQSEHLTRLVDDLLEVTRISRGKIQLRREVVDLRDLVRRTCEDHRALFDDVELELRLDLPAGPVWAAVDPTRIAQVVSNLLNNANKFTPAQGTVTVVVRQRDRHACICVRDTGAGMDPERIAHLFEPFAQEDRSLARTRGGLGLGLALVKGLVELHGGAIAATSEGPGKGSAFEITMPLTAPDAAPDPPAAPPSDLHVSTQRTVLVIEDEIDAARTLKEVLEVIGHRVTLARDGLSGLALARAQKPDVIVCDLGLPDMDGYEVAAELRRDAALRSTRLIALSGYAQPEDRERAREAGFDAHLPKPPPLDELAAMLA